MHLRPGEIVRATRPIFISDLEIEISRGTEGIVEDAPKHADSVRVAWETTRSNRPTTVSGRVHPSQVIPIH